MGKGQQVLTGDLFRGGSLVRSEDEWRSGYRAYMRARLVFDSFTIGTLGTFFVIGAYLWVPILGLLVLVAVGMVALTEALSHNTTSRVLREGGAPPGVYEVGLEMPMFPLYATRLFIPWTEMEDAWVKRSRMADDTLFIAVRDSRWRWRFPGRLLGEDGIQEVLARARSPRTIDLHRPVQEAPRLVIYSADGAKSESVPEET